MKKTTERADVCTPQQFLEQVRLGATVLPQLSTVQIGVQVGRRQYLCDVRRFTAPEAAMLETLYRAGQLTFGHPGDFHFPPSCFRDRRLRFTVVDAATISSVPEWMRRPRRSRSALP